MPKSNPEIETRILTGFRLNALQPQQQAYAAQQLIEKLSQLVPMMEQAKAEPFYIDDSMRHMDGLQLLTYNMANQEVCVCIHEGEVAAVAALTDILPGRSVTFEGWTHPAYRTDYRHRRVASAFAHEVFDYCFRPFGQIKDGGGLGVAKIKAEVAVPNRASYRTLKALHFQDVGISRLDGLYNGVPVDMVLMELLNPAFFGQVVEEKLVSGQGKRAEGADIHAASAVRVAGAISGTAGSELDRAAGSNAKSGNEPRRRRRKQAAAVDATRSESDVSAGDGAVSEQLLSTANSAPVGATTSSPSV